MMGEKKVIRMYIKGNWSDGKKGFLICQHYIDDVRVVEGPNVNILKKNTIFLIQSYKN